jgi:hypothetical protein
MVNDQKVMKAYGPLLGLSALFALGAALSLVPWDAARWNNIIGYKSLCTFSPISSAICALLAAATCTIRSRFFGPRRGERRPLVAPIAVGLALALVIGFSIVPYAKAKADATSGATPISAQR